MTHPHSQVDKEISRAERDLEKSNADLYMLRVIKERFPNARACTIANVDENHISGHWSDPAANDLATHVDVHGLMALRLKGGEQRIRPTSHLLYVRIPAQSAEDEGRVYAPMKIDVQAAFDAVNASGGALPLLDAMRSAAVAETPKVPPVKAPTAPVPPTSNIVEVRKGSSPGELRYVLGIVMSPGFIDEEGYLFDTEAIRQSEWHYMEQFRNDRPEYRIVESFIAPCNMAVNGISIVEGTWLMGLHIVDEALWERVKTGQLPGMLPLGAPRFGTRQTPMSEVAP